MEIRNFTPVGVTFETIDHLAKLDSDALALYMAYAAITQWQGTYQPKATSEFMMERLKWGRRKFAKAKNILTEKRLVEDIRKLDDNGKVCGWYVKINHIVANESEKNHPTQSTHCGLGLTVDNDQTSTLNYQGKHSQLSEKNIDEKNKKNKINQSKTVEIDENPTDKDSFFSSLPCEELLYQEIDNTFDTKQKTFAKKGLRYAPSKRTAAQEIVTDAMKLVDEIRKKGEEDGWTYYDTSASNQKEIAVTKAARKKLTKAEMMEIINWFFTTKMEQVAWKRDGKAPTASIIFSSDTLNTYANRNKLDPESARKEKLRRELGFS